MNERALFFILMFYFLIAFITATVSGESALYGDYSDRVSINPDDFSQNLTSEEYLESLEDTGILSSADSMWSFVKRFLVIILTMASLNVEFTDTSFWNNIINVLLFTPCTFVIMFFSIKMLFKLAEALPWT